MLALTGVRAVWGIILLAAPGRLLRRVSTRPPSVAGRMVAGVLGVRDLVQAVVLARRPSRLMIAAGAAVDSLHSATMLLLAIRRPEHRAPALSSALIAAVFGFMGARRAWANA